MPTNFLSLIRNETLKDLHTICVNKARGKLLIQLMDHLTFKLPLVSYGPSVFCFFFFCTIWNFFLLAYINILSDVSVQFSFCRCCLHLDKVIDLALLLTSSG